MYNNRARHVVNKNFAATSTVRLIEAFIPAEPEQSARVILKPKAVKKKLPGTALLIKLAKQREHEKEKRANEREASRVAGPCIDAEAVEEAVEDIFEALEI